MKKTAVITMLVALLCAPPVFGACTAGTATDADCALWEGDWNITLEGNQTATWSIDYTTTTETGASYIKCLAKGTQKQTGKDDVLFQVIWLTFDGSYHYYPTQGSLTPGDSGTKIDLCKDGQSFTVTNTSPVGILSGVKAPSCKDNDGDSYGEGCAAGPDCDDTNKAVNPGAQEVCDDSIDNDCDNQIDEGCGGECVDNDNDTYGENCDAGPDCDDTDTAVNPGAQEVCDDGKDNDCDQSIDCDDSDCQNEAICQPCVISVNPGIVKARKLLPKFVVFTITGSGTGFNASNEVIFDGTAITKLYQTAQGSDKIMVIGLLKRGTSGSTVTVSVDGCGSSEVTIE